MHTRNLPITLIAILVLLLAGNNALLADGGNYEPDLNALTSVLVYPGSIPFAYEDTLSRLTNDGLAKIEAFYRKSVGPNELIEPFAAENERGFTVSYRVKVEGALTERARLTVSMPDSMAYKALMEKYPSAAIMPLPLTRMQQLVGRFGHTQAQYDKLENAYQWLRYVKYFKEPGQDAVTAGDVIYQRHYEKVFGAMPKNAPKDKAGDAATRADLEKKKKELKRLKEEGRMQEMMALAMEMHGQMAGTAAGEEATAMQDRQLEGIQKDSWDEWLACLKELAAAVYWVRLEYSTSEGFWEMPK